MFCNRFGKVERFMKIDLHMHSNASDGTDEPRKLIQKAAEQGFEAVALTDHDTVDGLDAAAEEAAQRESAVCALAAMDLSEDKLDAAQRRLDSLPGHGGPQ